MAAGLLLVRSSAAQREVALRAPLADVIPAEIVSYTAEDMAIPDWEAEAVGMDTWLMRTYRSEAAATPFFTLYVGYYESQRQGRTIHSPRNCLPGAGWEVLEFERQPLETPLGGLTVARYLIQRGGQRALVLYWYQGRGRVESGEYAVKLQLLRDAALRGRTEEALVRVMVPLDGDPGEPLGLASAVARSVIPALFDALPEV